MANVPISGLPFGVGPMTGNEAFPGVSGGVTYQWSLSQMLQAIPGGYVPNSREINTGTGLQGGGDLTANLTLSLANTAVSPGVYGGATTVAQVTIDQQGRITSAVNVAISFAGYVPDTRQVIAGTGLSGGGALSSDVTLDLANTAVAAASYGGAATVGTFTVDAQGRLTAAADVAIAIANTAVSGLGTAATQNTGTSGATLPFLNGTNTWSGAQTFTTSASYGTVVTMEGTSTDAGPIMAAYGNSATPAAFDNLFYIQVSGNSSTAVKRTVGEIYMQYVDPTNASEDARWGISTIIAGTKATRWWVGAGLYADGTADPGAGVVNATGYQISGTNIFGRANTWTGTQIFNNAAQTPLSVQRTGVGTTVVELNLKMTPAGGGATGNIAQISTNFLDDAGNEYQGTVYRATQTDATNGNEDTSIGFFTVTAGAGLVSQMALSSGAVVGAATGGAQGVGTLNAAALYDDGVQILPITPLTMTAASGQSEIDFTGIPATARRVTVTFNGLSLSGTDNMLIQLGDAGGPENTGYVSVSADIDGSETTVSSTAGIIIKVDAAADAIHGQVIFTLMDAATFLWTCSGILASSNGTSSITTSGSKALSAVLTQVRIDTTGTNTFDAGTVNVVYE